MDKKLIERIALEVLDSLIGKPTDPRQTDREAFAEFAIAFLARIDAERGQSVGTFCSRRLEPRGTNEFWGLLRDGVSLDAGAELFTAPTIPEGMCLVPIEPTEEMLMEGRRADATWCEVETDINVFESGLVAIYKAMLQAAQGEK